MDTGNAFKNFARIARSTAWQQEGWNFYHSIGEFRYACDLQGSLISRAVLYASHDVEGKPVAITEGKPAEVLNAFFTDADGRSEMLRMAGIHLAVAGEFFIVGFEDPEEKIDTWQVVATTALKRNGDEGRWIINNVTLDIDPSQVLVIRIWRPDPENPELAMSPTRSVLPILGEIFRLTEHVAAQVDSRLAGAGILLVPSEITFPAPPVAEGEVIAKTANTAEDLMAILQEAMAASIQNRSDASALVPIVITAPKDAIAAVQHMTFWTQLDGQAIELRKEAIRRLALGMDLPPEMLLGMGTGNHWAAWQADESAIKAHSEPLLKIITTALGVGYLRPALRDDPEFKDALATYSVKADTADMRLRPNRSKEALELYDRGVLNAVALRRETGFDPTDAMDDNELQLFFLRKVAAGVTTPEVVEAALRAMKVPIGAVAAPDAPAGQEKAPTQNRPAPSLKDHPVQDIPDREKSERRKQSRAEGNVPSADVARKSSAVSVQLVAAAEQIALRAVERAGNKLKNKSGAKFTVPAVELYQFVAADNIDFLLEDAWTGVPAVAARNNVDPDWLTRSIHGYCSELIRTQTPHEYARFAGFLTLSHDLDDVLEKESA